MPSLIVVPSFMIFALKYTKFTFPVIPIGEVSVIASQPYKKKKNPSQNLRQKLAYFLKFPIKSLGASRKFLTSQNFEIRSLRNAWIEGNAKRVKGKRGRGKNWPGLKFKLIKSKHTVGPTIWSFTEHIGWGFDTERKISFF